MSDSAGEPVTPPTPNSGGANTRVHIQTPPAVEGSVGGASNELNALRTELCNSVPSETIDRLVRAAMRAGARRLLEALDLEGTIAPCGQGCGWEGPWAIDSTLWPADRERLLDEVFVPSAQSAEIEKRRRLLGSGLGAPQ